MPRRMLFFVALTALTIVSACLRERPPAEPYPPGQQTGQGYGGAGYPPPAPYPTTAPTPSPSVPPEPPPTAPTAPPESPPAPGPAAAPGFPCASDNDLQCPFARCISGRCGGCQSATDCKSGATCAQSPLGMACMPGGGSSSPPATPPTTPTSTPPPTTPPSTDAFAAARARCIQRINEYRAKGNAPAVSQRTDKQSCADSQAQSDAATSTAHGAFGKCGETAQNECPGWKGSVDTVLDGCLQAMFAEGPGTGPAHGHYNNMMDPSYKGAACGFFQAADGGIWIIHDFYR